jgi:hypothetical protein
VPVFRCRLTLDPELADQPFVQQRSELADGLIRPGGRFPLDHQRIGVHHEGDLGAGDQPCRRRRHAVECGADSRVRARIQREHARRRLARTREFREHRCRGDRQ